MAVVYEDSFARPDSSNDPGAPSVGGPYTVELGTWGITTNRLRTPGSTANAVISYPSTYDFDATFKWTGASGYSGVGFRRATPTSRHLMLTRSANGMISLYYAASMTSYTQIAPNIPYSGLVTMRIIALGPWITYKVTSDSGSYWGPFIKDEWTAPGPVSGYYRANNNAVYFHSGVVDSITTLPADLQSGPGRLLTGLHNFVAGDLQISPMLYKGRDTSTADQGAQA